MSITITTDVFCDEEGCGWWIFGVVGKRTNASGARCNAGQQGWVHWGGKDFCPAHHPTGRRVVGGNNRE